MREQQRGRERTRKRFADGGDAERVERAGRGRGGNTSCRVREREVTPEGARAVARSEPVAVDGEERRWGGRLACEGNHRPSRVVGMRSGRQWWGATLSRPLSSVSFSVDAAGSGSSVSVVLHR